MYRDSIKQFHPLEIIKKMTSVKIKFRKSSLPNKEGVLYFQLIHKRKVKLITTRFRLFQHEWNGHLATTVINKKDSDRDIYLQSINIGLQVEIQQINQIISFFEKRCDYTVYDLADYYINHSFNGCLFPFIKHLIKQLTSEERKKTASIYATVQRSFSQFRNREDIMIDKIDSILISRYELYLKNNNVSMNSISCYMRAFRSIYNQAVNRSLTIQRNPFKNVYTGIDKTIKRAVNESIISKLKRLKLQDNGLNLARDIFMFSFYTRGMSFVDMANLKQKNSNNGYIIYSRSKTKQTLKIRIEKCIKEILDKYQHSVVDNYLLPIYTSQNYDYNSHLRTYNKRLFRISEMLKLEKPLSSYVARHSWATIAFHKGVSVEIISEGMGHESENTTRIYLASLDQSIIDNANAQIITL